MQKEEAPQFIESVPRLRYGKRLLPLLHIKQKNPTRDSGSGFSAKVFLNFRGTI